MAFEDINESEEVLDEGVEAITPTDIEPFIGGASYPLAKEDLIDLATTREAPEDIVALLETLEERDYDSLADVVAELGLGEEVDEQTE